MLPGAAGGKEEKMLGSRCSENWEELTNFRDGKTLEIVEGNVQLTSLGKRRS